MGKMDTEYFARRLREEQEAAAKATPQASAVHKELADRYANVLAAYEKDAK